MSMSLSTTSVLDAECGVEQFIPVHALRVDESYQRELNRQRAMKIAREFSFELAGRLIVSQREDNSFYVVDGRHRLAAMQIKHLALAPCVVYSGWTPKNEAQIFYIMNTTAKNPTPFERHKAALLIGEPIAVAIDQLVHGIGGEITERHPESGYPHRIAAVEMLRRIYRYKGDKSGYNGPQCLQETLSIIMDVWGHLDYQRGVHQIAPFHADIVMGLAAFLVAARKDRNWSERKLREALSTTTPHRIAQAATVFIGAKPSIGIAVKIKELYNKGKREATKLGDWPISVPF